MDEVDSELLRLLSEKGRASWAELAQSLQLSAPSVAERVRKLEDQGIIRSFAALLDPEKIGLPLSAYIAVTLDHPKRRRAFLEWVAVSKSVIGCDHVAGEGDYLLKVRCATIAALEHLLSEELKSLAGVVRTKTTIVLKTEKESQVSPL